MVYIFFCFTIVSLPIVLGLGYFTLFKGIGQSPANLTMETLIICVAISLLGYITGVAAIALLVGNTYFYERHVEMHRFLPFMKRSVIYYDKMHVHIKQNGRVLLNHYETPPRFWKSPYTWFKANFIAAMNITLFANPEILQFIETKAQSVNTIKTTARATLPTTMRTTNTHEQPVYELKPRELRYGAYYLALIFLLLSCYMWGVEVPKLMKVGGLEMLIKLVMSVIFLPAGILMISILGDIYFYDRYVEIRRFFPFMKRYVIYYDEMHVRIMQNGGVNLSPYRTPPKLLESPYTWFKANTSDFIGLTRYCTPEILEFVKTKAQSVSHCNFMGQKLN